MVAQQPGVTGFENHHILLFLFTIMCVTKKKAKFKAFIRHVTQNKV